MPNPYVQALDDHTLRAFGFLLRRKIETGSPPTATMMELVARAMSLSAPKRVSREGSTTLNTTIKGEHTCNAL